MSFRMNMQPPPPPPFAAQVAPVAYAANADARDADHLRLLSIFHYVYGGVAALFSCFFIIYIVIGVAALNGSIPFPQPMPPPPTTVSTTVPATMPVQPFPAATFGWMFIAMG